MLPYLLHTFILVHAHVACRSLLRKDHIIMVQLSDAARHTILFEYDKLKSISGVTKKLGCNRKTINIWVPRVEQQKQLVELEATCITH
jgi:hypothetical protein